MCRSVERNVCLTSDRQRDRSEVCQAFTLETLGWKAINIFSVLMCAWTTFMCPNCFFISTNACICSDSQRAILFGVLIYDGFVELFLGRPI